VIIGGSDGGDGSVGDGNDCADDGNIHGDDDNVCGDSGDARDDGGRHDDNHVVGKRCESFQSYQLPGSRARLRKLPLRMLGRSRPLVLIRCSS
jgi:hypothetical protein